VVMGSGAVVLLVGQWHWCPVEDAGIAESLDGSCDAMVMALGIR
jgi:hypothetical protein